MDSRSETIFDLTVEKNDKFTVLINRGDRYLTTHGEAVVLTDTLEPGSHWVIRNPLKAVLNPDDGWLSLESASDPDRFLRHFSLSAYAHKTVELTPGRGAPFLSDASWKFVDSE